MKAFVMEDTDLRKQLVHFRENVIYGENPLLAEFRKHCILRRAMIDWLITQKPHDLGSGPVKLLVQAALA